MRRVLVLLAVFAIVVAYTPARAEDHVGSVGMVIVNHTYVPGDKDLPADPGPEHLDRINMTPSGVPQFIHNIEPGTHFGGSPNGYCVIGNTSTAPPAECHSVTSDLYYSNGAVCIPRDIGRYKKSTKNADVDVNCPPLFNSVSGFSAFDPLISPADVGDIEVSGEGPALGIGRAYSFHCMVDTAMHGTIWIVGA